MKKQRVDLLLVERGLVESRSQAQRLVMAGQVRADGQLVPKPASAVDPGAELTIEGGPRFVSRGGEKLDAALRAFTMRVKDRVVADVGASTGGFTDCLLQHGAARVYAIDVGQGILHWKLRNDPRVEVMEGINARYLTELPETVGLVTVDASFISIKKLLPVMLGWIEDPGAAIILIKPQFEAGRRQAARGAGVIRDPAVHRAVLGDVLQFAAKTGFFPCGLIRSPLTGPKGNVEFLAWLQTSPSTHLDLEKLIAAAVGGPTGLTQAGSDEGPVRAPNP